jgi:cytochrome c
MPKLKPLSMALALAMISAGVAHADGDPVKGKEQFGPCSACHNVAAGAPNMTGPNLHGVFGKKAGTTPANFDYSAALKASGIVWNEQTLDKWITSPADLVPGTKMEFVGIGRKETRSNIIAYLKQATK